MVIPKRGEIYLVDFDPALGREIKKARPAVIIQNDIGNKFSPLTIVAPITSSSSGLHLVKVTVRAGQGGLSKNSFVLLNQIRALDKRRLIKRIGKLKTETMYQINQAILISLGLVDI